MTDQPTTVPDPDDQPDPPAWSEVTILADHDGEQRKHIFKTRLELDWKDLVAVTRFNARGGDEIDMMPVVARVLRRAMCDEDGVPARWSPKVSHGQFTAPDGAALPVARLGEFLPFEVGSSSRRWRALLNDDDVSIDPAHLMDAWGELQVGATERPTRR